MPDWPGQIDRTYLFSTLRSTWCYLIEKQKWKEEVGHQAWLGSSFNLQIWPSHSSSNLHSCEMGRRPVLRLQRGAPGTVEGKWLGTIKAVCLRGEGVICMSNLVELSLTLTSGLSSLAFSRLGHDFASGSSVSCKDHIR